MRSIRENICCDVMPYGPNEVRSVRHDATTNIFFMDQTLLYTHTSKTTKSQCFPLLLWTEVQPVHTPVRTWAYGPALSQSNFSILSVFCLVYNNCRYSFFTRDTYADSFITLFRTWLQTCFVIVTTIWRPGLIKALSRIRFHRKRYRCQCKCKDCIVFTHRFSVVFILFSLETVFKSYLLQSFSCS